MHEHYLNPFNFEKKERKLPTRLRINYHNLMIAEKKGGIKIYREERLC